MIRLSLAMILGVAIGAACRWAELPVPAPPSLLGVLLIASLTVGYLIADFLIAVK